MPKAIVLGATGHIGSYMTPALVKEGYDVVAVSRGNRLPYTSYRQEWNHVRRVSATREEAIQTLIDKETDLVCDLLPYTKNDAERLIQSFSKAGILETVRLISIGSIWIYEKKFEIPVSETHPRTATDEYGLGKIEIEQYLMSEHRDNGLKVTILHPGHVCGNGWMPVGPQGNRDPQVIRDIINGKTILLPDAGQATLHHVHADDIAGLAVACLKNDCSIGEAFHSVCPTALTLFGFAEQLYRYFLQEPAITFTGYQEFLATLNEENAAASAEHIERSPIASMDKARNILGFVPKHSAIDTVIEAVESIRGSL